MSAPWCGRPLPDDRDGWRTRALAFKESAEEAEAERDKAQALAASLSEDWHRMQGECQRLRGDIRSLVENLRGSATPDAIGSDGWYVDMAISTLEKMLQE